MRQAARSGFGTTLVVVGLMLTSVPATVAAARPAAMPSDFNGDGYADLAVGVPGEDIGSKVDAGAVNVLYGSSNGLTAEGDQYWSEDSPGVKGKASGAKRYAWRGDRFGAELASGDFDGDGYADLAVSAPGARTGASKVRTGAVNVLYGSKHGLTADGDQRWTRSSLAGMSTKGDQVGAPLATGDFDHDGDWDLAIGVPTEGGGGVIVLPGGPAGLSATGAIHLDRAMTGAPTIDGSRFGISMAAGDLDDDGFADLAVGSFEGTEGYDTRRGGVGVFYGGQAGLGSAGSQWWTQESPGMAEGGDGSDFGASLAIGDFNADEFGDLAIGVPDETPPASFDSRGAIAVIYGSPAGLSTVGNQREEAPADLVPGNDDHGSQFGRSLAVGDFDGDGADDLAVGAPTAGQPKAWGVAVVLYGGGLGLGLIDAQLWSQESAGVPGRSSYFDAFGNSLASADFGRSGRDDLAIGVPGENLGRGRVIVVYGRASGLDPRHLQAWTQDSSGINGRAELEDQFGSSLP